MNPISASSQLPLSTPTKKTLPFSSTTPIKPKSQSQQPSDDRFWTPTPEKQAQPSRVRSAVAFSLSGVRRAALRLNRKDRGVEVDEQLDRGVESVERKLRSDKSAEITSVCEAKDENHEIELPRKYQILCEIFNSMECSIRLLRLKGSSPTFSNLYSRIQDLANQNLTYNHIAQMKHILPEAIILKKVLLRDEITCCMKPELQIGVNFEGIGISMKEEGHNAYLQLRKLFRERIGDFVRAHPEEGDIPEEELPHPFNNSINLSSPPKKPIKKENNTFLSKPEPIILSHMPSSFQRQFMQKSSLNISPTNSPDKCTKNASEYTPMKPMVLTPAMKTPKRCFSETESNVDLHTAKKKESKRSARSLLFTSLNESIEGRGEQGERELVEMSDGDGVLDFLPKSLLQSVKEKERKVLFEKETGVADAVRRQRMIGLLPNTFNTILLAYRSMQRSVMTKQELIHKIIVNNSKIVDRDEVEEQLRLLQEIVPNWISEKTALSGDILIRCNMLCCPEEIRERLAKAE